MAATVEEVKAFKSIDGEVFDTFQKAHHRNIWYLCHQLFGSDDGMDISESAAKRLVSILISSRNGPSIAVLRRLTEELE